MRSATTPPMPFETVPPIVARSKKLTDSIRILSQLRVDKVISEFDDVWRTASD